MNLIVDGIFGTHKYCNFREFVVLVARVLSPWLREHKNILIYVYLILVVCFSSLCFLFFFYFGVQFILFVCLFSDVTLTMMPCWTCALNRITRQFMIHITVVVFRVFTPQKEYQFWSQSHKLLQIFGGKISGGILVTSTFSPSFEYHSNKMNTNTWIKVAQRCNILLINTWCVCLCKFWHLSYERAVPSIQWNQHTIFLMLEKSD